MSLIISLICLQSCKNLLYFIYFISFRPLKYNNESFYLFILHPGHNPFPHLSHLAPSSPTPAFQSLHAGKGRPSISINKI